MDPSHLMNGFLRSLTIGEMDLYSAKEILKWSKQNAEGTLDDRIAISVQTVWEECINREMFEHIADLARPKELDRVRNALAKGDNEIYVDDCVVFFAIREIATKHIYAPSTSPSERGVRKLLFFLILLILI